MTDYHTKGQYFTEDKYLQNTVISLIFNIPSKILEPSIGRGDLVIHFQKIFGNIPVDMYELDNEIVMLEGIKKEEIVYGDFMIIFCQCFVRLSINILSPGVLDAWYFTLTTTSTPLSQTRPSIKLFFIIRLTLFLFVALFISFFATETPILFLGVLFGA